VTSGALDQHHLDALRAFGDAPGVLLGDMLDDFLVEAPELLAEIELAVEQDSYPAMAGAAHRLSGISGHLGALRLAGVANAVERDARAESVDVAVSTAATRTEVALAISAVSDLRSPAGGSGAGGSGAGGRQGS
jgi:HPt (histidine-containing phosphotransfer) domain-containing protein